MGKDSKNKVHYSWLIGWVSLGFVVGCGLCALIDASVFFDKNWLGVASFGVIIGLYNRTRLALILVLLSGCIFGLWRGSQVKADLYEYKPFYGKAITLHGRVSEDTSYGPKGDQRIRLTDIIIDEQPLKGQVWSSTIKTDIKRGDNVTISGKINEGFGNLSASMYRAQVLGIERPYPGDVARRVRDRFGSAVRQGISEPAVNLGLGYLLGQKTALPPDLEEQIRIVGLSHVVVASGYNLTILVVFARRIFLKVSKYLAVLTSGLLILSFVMITGLSPSITRAGLVAGLGLLVWYYGRTMHPFILLSFAAAITVLFNPSYVWGDLGWYLSFTAFIGVIVLAPLLHAYFWEKSEEIPAIRDLLVSTSAAQIMTAPLIMLAFGKLSIYALPANLLVLPFVPLAMLGTFAAGVSGLLFPGFSALVALPATTLLNYSIFIIKKFAQLPYSDKEILFNPELMTVAYICIGLIIIFLIRRTKHDFRNDNQPEILR